jgi:hypothetical protein
MLHITDGESVAGTLREAAIPGSVAIYGDLLYEGPAPAGLNAGLDADAWRDIRARFMAESGYTTLEQAQQYLKACDDALAAFPQHEEVVIWLDYRLSDQLILIKVLDWFSHQHLGAVKLSLIDRFATLGQLTAVQLASLADTRLPVTDAQFRLAHVAWNAFTSPDPTAIERLIKGDTSALPFLAAAFHRHLEQFPSVDGGLSRTERQALSVLHEQGSLSAGQLFAKVQRLEERIFMGDGSFHRIIAELAAGPHPLLQTERGDVTITEAGLNVLDGRAGHIELNGVDRWLGGVHLKGGHAAWRWDRTSGRLVAFAGLET